MTPTRPLRLGIIGCGDVFQRAYMPFIERLRSRGLVTVTMACSRRKHLWPYFQSQFGISSFTDQHEEVVESDEVDIVLVLTNMQTHAQISRAALEAGKHVLVEKPFATTLEEGIALTNLARQSPGFFVPAPFVILSPTFRAIAQHILQGDIGRPLLARARYGWSGPSWGKWFYELGGGAIFDLGVYNLTTLTGLLGPVKRVMAMTGIAIPQRVVEGELIEVKAEDNAQILLDFGNNVFAVVTTGFTMQQYRSPAVEVYGSEGTIQMLGDDWAPNGYELWQQSRQAWIVFPELAPDWSWCDGLFHLVECIREGRSPIVTPEHALHVLEIMLSAQESGRDGMAKTLRTTFPYPIPLPPLTFPRSL